MVYIGMTAARKTSIRGMAFKLVLELLRDNLRCIPYEKELFAISTISTPFTYNYYKRFTTIVYPNDNGFVSSSIEKLFCAARKSVFHHENNNFYSWHLKDYTKTRYNMDELKKINTYLGKNKNSIFDKSKFNLLTGDRIAVIGIIDRLKLVE